MVPPPPLGLHPKFNKKNLTCKLHGDSIMGTEFYLFIIYLLFMSAGTNCYLAGCHHSKASKALELIN